MFATLGRLLRAPSPWFGGFGALLYCSWPLAWLLNPTVARHSLASQLQAPGQPYSWLFIATDVTAGALLLIAGFLQLRGGAAPSHLPFAVVACYVAFGVLAMGAAVTPLTCDPSMQVCGPLLRHPLTIAHGAMSITSVLALLAALIVVAALLYRRGASRRTLALVNLVGFCWLIFGVGSLGDIWWHLHVSTELQDFFITVCSVTALLAVTGVEYMRRPSHAVVVVTPRTPAAVYNDDKG
ncbi:MAG TPA: DUF998 domain-containing protein [Candidatus Saccharimonadales bacterium]